MQRAHFYNIYRSVHQRLFSCKDDKVFWEYCNPSLRDSFVGYLQLFSGKTSTTLTSSAFFAYPIHVALLNTSPIRRDLLINKVYKIIGFLYVSISDFNIDLDDIVSDIVDADFQLLPMDDYFLLTSSKSEER